MHVKQIKKAKNWTTREVQQVATLYKRMQELDAAGRLGRGKDFTKSGMVKPLAEKLGRSVPSVECKMMNMSYVLTQFGRDWLKGYKPLSNVNGAMYQQMARQFNLIDEVA